MASALFDKGREAFLGPAAGQSNWTNDNIKAVFIDAADYTPDLAVHDNLDDIPAGARVGISGNLTGKTVTNGVADADDITVPLVSGDPFEYVGLFKDTGVESTSRLIALIDTGTGLPFTPSGGDVSVVWDNGVNKIFKL